MRSELLQRMAVNGNILDRVEGAQERAEDLVRHYLTYQAADGRYMRAGTPGGVRPVFNAVTMFGLAEANSAEANDEALALATAELASVGRGVLYIPQGTYKVTPVAGGPLNVSGMSNFKIIGDNAMLYSDPVDVSDGLSRRLALIDNCSDFEIAGIHFKLQVDFASSLSAPVDRVDQLLAIRFLGGESRRFSVHDCTFEYSGPQLHDPGSSIESRLSALILVGGSAGTSREVGDFRIYANHFERCMGRILYLVNCENGVVFGNTFHEVGYYDDGAGATGCAGGFVYRLLGCKNVDVHVGVVTGYSGAISGGFSEGEMNVCISGQGDSAGRIENVRFHDGIIEFNNAPGVALQVNSPGQQVEYANITVIGNESYAGGSNQMGIKLDDPYGTVVANGLRFLNIALKHLDVHFDVTLADVAAYDDVLLDNVQAEDGSNLTTRYDGGAAAVFRRQPDVIHTPDLRLAVHFDAHDESGNVISAEGFGKSFAANNSPTFNVHRRMPYVDYTAAAYHLLADAAFNRITSDLTVGCWVNFNNAAGSIEWICGRVANATSNTSWYLRRNSNGTLQFAVSPDGTAGALVVVNSTQVVAQGVWTYVVGRYTPSSELAIYINGLSTTNTTSVPAAAFAGTSGIAIGAQSNGTSGINAKVARWFMASRALAGRYIIEKGQRERSLLYNT